ncbi:MAG: radical SAM protein [Clostridia bacterium]|nr:radical SAM protein [Clostridia bacterium]
MFNKIYVEIGNICNLACSFCPTLKRAKRQMTKDEFERVCMAIKGHTDYIYLHVMGEPLLHPELDGILDIAKKYGFRVCITTNGTLLAKNKDLIIRHSDTVHKINVSVHSLEGNGIEERIERYMGEVVECAKHFAELGIYTIFRLWNLDSRETVGANLQNEKIESILKAEFQDEWKKRWNGYTVSNRIFLEFAGAFVWPIESDAEAQCVGSCRGLIDQIAILSDGRVVPCCLDSEGVISLGNIFESSLEDILSSPRATSIKEGFLCGEMRDDFCKKCSYAHRFSKKAKRMAGEI